jgi:hypothetical protein
MTIKMSFLFTIILQFLLYLFSARPCIETLLERLRTVLFANTFFYILCWSSPGLDTQSMFRSKNEQEFQKLEVDLITVFEKVKLCREMLQVSPGIKTDEALAEVVGFLEACRDRMADVIEAGTQGLLNEELLAKCFRANDAIFRTLDAEKVS